MSLSCLVLDDEPLAIDVIENHLQAFPAISITKKCLRAVEALQFMHENKVDLIFLDIEMPRISGIQFLNSLRQVPLVVFTTAHREYALDGYDFSIVDFLLKPISFERFAVAIEKVMQHRVKHSNTKPKVEEQMVHDVFVKSGSKIIRTDLSKVVYVEGMKDYLKLHVEDGKMVLMKKTMKSLEEELEPYGFLRVHKSYLVPVSKIQSVAKNQINIGKHCVPIGRNYQQHLRNVLEEKLFD